MSTNKETEAILGLTDVASREKTFTKEFTINGKTRVGEFVAVIPSIGKRIQIGVERAKLSGGLPSNSLDGFTSDLVYMFPYLNIVCTKKPKWFDLNLIDETEKIYELFEEVSEWVNRFFNPDGVSGYDTADSESELEQDVDSI